MFMLLVVLISQVALAANEKPHGGSYSKKQMRKPLMP